MSKIEKIIEFCAERGISDIHLTSGFLPFIRNNGDLGSMKNIDVLTEEELILFMKSVDCDIEKYKRDKSIDASFPFANVRFRLHASECFSGTSISLRLIPNDIPDFESLYLPDPLRYFLTINKGIVLVTGPTGSGKSTTLASMIQKINQIQRKKIITIEDPIEFLYPSGNSYIIQRQLDYHTPSFSSAIRDAMREDPDVILVGEMRDLDTIQNAITAAETGHVVFGTLHTTSAAKTIDRIIDVFPEGQQAQIRVQLASVIQGVVSQTLIPSSNGGRVPACEVLIPNAAIRNLITDKNSKIQMINDQIRASYSKKKGQTYVQSLKDLIGQRLITWDQAISVCTEDEEKSLRQIAGRS